MNPNDLNTLDWWRIGVGKKLPDEMDELKISWKRLQMILQIVEFLTIPVGPIQIDLHIVEWNAISAANRCPFKGLAVIRQKLQELIAEDETTSPGIQWVVQVDRKFMLRNFDVLYRRS